MQVSVKAKPPECITAKNIKIGKDDRKMYASPAHAVLKKYHLFSLYVIFSISLSPSALQKIHL